jgi:DNA-binding NarL/FixJ family response regulator
MLIEPSAARHETRVVRPAACAEHKPADEGLEALSTREKQVLTLIAKGLHAADVARVLEISINTVCTHLKSIYRKRNLGSRAEAALEAQRLGLIK